MAAESEHLIQGAIRTNKSFLRDLRRFFDAPTALLRAIANKTGSYPYVALSDTNADELARQFDEQTEDVQHIAALLLFLKERLVEEGKKPLDAVVEGQILLADQNLARGREDEVADVLSYSKAEREEALALQALAEGPVFLNVQLRPSLLAATPSGTEVVGGYLWTISYLNAEGEQRSITIGLTPGELEQLETTIELAKEQLRTMKHLVDSTRTVEG